MLEQLFKIAIAKYQADQVICESLWREIANHYSEKKRHYHNLNHLHNLLNELHAVKEQIEDWDAVVFALFYHDIIYKATANDNEEKSAALARDRLQQLSFPEAKIKKCEQLIFATKGHTVSNDNDTNLFTDADLSILGKPWELYQEYFQQVRLEYKIFPDLLYKPGRKKVLLHFLTMPRIFKTEHFYQSYESQADKYTAGDRNVVSKVAL